MYIQYLKVGHFSTCYLDITALQENSLVVFSPYAVLYTNLLKNITISMNIIIITKRIGKA